LKYTKLSINSALNLYLIEEFGFMWHHVASLIKIREFNDAYSIRVFLVID